MNAMTINEAITELKIQKRGVLLDDCIKEQDKNGCVEAIDIAISSLKREHRPSVKAEFPPDVRNAPMTRSETIERLNIMLEQLEPIRYANPNFEKDCRALERAIEEMQLPVPKRSYCPYCGAEFDENNKLKERR